MNNWDKTLTDRIYKQKIKSVKPTLNSKDYLMSAFNSPNAASKRQNARKSNQLTARTLRVEASSNPKNAYKKQQFLKRLLRESGISQYLRKFYELGYDDSNLHKLGRLSNKEADDLSFNLKIFPGHKVKLIGFLENVSKIYGGTARAVVSSKTGSTSTRFFSVNTVRNKKQRFSPYLTATQYKTKPKSVETMRTQNRMLKSVAKGQGFGFNYYLGEQEPTSRPVNSGKSAGSGSTDTKSDTKSIKDAKISSINDEIDKMLNYYVLRLNAKLDESEDDLESEDSSLSNLQSFKNPKCDKLAEMHESISQIDRQESGNKSNKGENSTLNNILEKEPLNKADKNEEDDEFNNDYGGFEEYREELDEKKKDSESVEEDIVVETEKEDVSAKDKPSEGAFQQVEKEKHIKEEESLRKSEEDKQVKFDQIRLTKSCDGDELRQNMDYFDIEYMCRCLGLAIMKHIESGKDKQHVLDLLDGNKKYSFFDSVFNNNLDIFFTFFNMEQKVQSMSNLDKLQLNSEHPNAEKDRPISYVSHIKAGGENKLDSLGAKPQSELDKELRVINEYFEMSGNERYKNVTQPTRGIMKQGLNEIKEVDSMEYCRENELLTVEQNKNKSQYLNLLKQSVDDLVGSEPDQIREERSEQNSPQNNKFSSMPDNREHNETPLHIKEEIVEPDKETSPQDVFESGEMESNYNFDITTVEKLKEFLVKSMEAYDDEYDYAQGKVVFRRYAPPTDPQQIFEFCANIMVTTKMEKEVIIICLIYIERLIFNTGLILNSRNWKRVIFTALLIASKIWDDDSFENNHFAQVFAHLKIGEINLLERSFLELINYKVYVKCSEYFKYFFIIKSIALKYNFVEGKFVPISVEKMMRLQEYAYAAQKKLKSKYTCLSKSALF